MRKSILAAALLAGLPGCLEPPPTWAKTGASHEDFVAANYRCTHDSFAAAHGDLEVMVGLKRMCMQADGWH